MTLTTLMASATKTAVYDDAGIDISALSADSTIKVRVTALTAAKRVRIVLYDSVNAFSAKIPVAAFALLGGLAASYPVTLAFSKKTLNYCRFGVTSAVLRLSIDGIDGATSVTLEAWIE